MTDSIIGNADIDALRSDVAALKDDVGRLIDHLKDGARDSVRNVADQFNGQVRGLSESASAQGERSVKALGAWVEEGPVLALLMAIGIGYIGARVFSR